jgi:hypothetical protein
MRCIGIALGALLLAAAPALAQRVDAKGVPYRAWDIDAGVGFLSLTSADSDLGDEGYASDNWNPSWTTSIDVGHFWNSHLKTEGGLSFLQRYETASSQDVLLAGGQHGYIFTRNEIRQVQVTAAATWQFFENTFAHLYVSGGARIGLLQIDSSRQSYLPSFPGSVYRPTPIEPLERHALRARVRPFGAVGSKSYFNERSFVRPEMVLAFNGQGLSQFGARLVFGVDF